MAEEAVSLLRQYMLGVYNLNSLEEIRFVKVILPGSVENTIKNAKYHFLHFLLDSVEEPTDIQFAFCVPVEFYLRAAFGGPGIIKIEE
jgi:hypothetical protein